MATGAQILNTFIKQTENAYNNVYKTFWQIAMTERTEFHPAFANGAAFVARKSAPEYGNSVEVEGALRISKLPYKRKLTPGASKHANGIEVILDSLDIYKFEDNRPNLSTAFLHHSYVRLAYYRPGAGDQWSPILCIRYDYAKPSDAHPIFHAQLETGEFCPKAKDMFTVLPKLKSTLTVHENVRVPTVNVVGATALLSLAADHLPLSRFPTMLQSVRAQKMFNDPWRCDYRRMDAGRAPGPMLSSCLYSGG